MKTIILSAGKGERLLPLTKDRPKILIELGDGSTLLSRQIDILLRYQEFTDIIIAAGHCADKIDEFVENSKNKKKLSVVYNPFYDTTGPLVTLWIVLNRINDTEFMFMNGDTLFNESVYLKIKDTTASRDEAIFLLCSESDKVISDDIKVQVSKDNKILEAGKNITNYDAVSAGLMIIKGKNSSSLFRNTLDRVSRRADFLSYMKTWHSFISDLSREKADIEPLLIRKTEWSEIDIHFELDELRYLLQKKISFQEESS